jgi:putative acetyltransferase
MERVRPPIDIRDERPGDRDAIREVNRQAFGQEQEGQLVDALRGRGAITLSLVALVDARVVGHILFSPVRVGSLEGVGLGPMAVLPADQRRGIGSRLVDAGLARLSDLGQAFVVVLGHPGFYPRFGFVPAHTQGLTCDWNGPADVFMVKILKPEAATALGGHVAYQPEFSVFA